MSIRPHAFAAAWVCLASASCMGWWLPGVDADRPGLALDELRDREEVHRGACASWQSLDEVEDEPDRYVDDVYLLTDDMIEACGDLMRAGQVDRGDYDDVDEMRGRLRVSVDDHRGRLEIVIVIDDLHDECAAHHLAMLELFDETEARLVAGGMMGRGMM